MSTLTKLFVLLLVVFSIAFTMMTISIVARTSEWRDLAEQYREHAKSADANLRNLIAANAAELASVRDTIRAQIDRVASLETEAQQLRGELASRTAELEQAAAGKSGQEAIARGLLAQLQVGETERAEYRSQRDGLEEANVDLTQRNIDLNERVNEQTAQLAVLLAQKRQFEQQLNLLRRENEQLAQSARRVSAGMGLEDASGAAMEGVEALTPVARSAIRGQVLEVSGDIAKLSVGSADGVQKGMIFVIHRDNAYVADLKISAVDPDESAGRIVQKESDPQVGDQATDALGLGAKQG